MTTTLIVLAHPERRSFTGAWAEATARACAEAGDEVIWSDLGQIGFDPAERADHYRGISPTDRFDPLKVQEDAAENCALPDDVSEEIRKIRAADRVIFHFPIWWFAPPAVLKGWFDRVLAHGALHCVDERFDTGMCRGKSALFCVTTGSNATESAFNGKEGDIRLLLWPAAYTLRYLGFSVYVPEVIHGIHGHHTGARLAEMEQRLKAALDGQSKLLAGLKTRERMQFNSNTDFDAEGRLRPDRPSHSPFIRHGE